MQLKQKIHLVLSLATAAFMFAGPAHASLVARYLDADSSVDAYYDTVLDLTWLRDVHSNPVAGGGSQLTWVGANDWATGVGSGWHLPTTDASDYLLSDMGALWNSGDMTADYFNGLVTDPARRPAYWSSTEAAGWGNLVHWYFFPLAPYQDTNTDSILAFSNTYAMAVHDGSVGRSAAGEPGSPVPEPQSMLLALAALGALGVVRRSA